MTVQRLVLDFRIGELVVRCLYRSKGDSNPGTNGRRTYALVVRRRSWRPHLLLTPIMPTVDYTPRQPRGVQEPWRRPR